MAESLVTEQEAKFLRELVRCKVDFMLIGLAAATLQGAPVVTQDIDLWFKDLSDPNLKKALDRVGGIYVPPLGYNPPMFAGEAVKLFDIALTVDGLGSFAAEKKQTIKIDLFGTRIPVLKLERILKSKRAANRKKDHLVIPVLEDLLLTRRRKRSKT